VKKLGEMMDFKATNSLSRENLNYETGSVKNIHYGDIHTKFETLFDVRKEVVPYVKEGISLRRISQDFYCQEGDIIFADASEDLNDVGKSIEIVNLNGEKVLSGLHTLLARPNKNYFHNGFNGFLFKSKNVRNQIKKEAQGSKVLSINVGRISKIDLSIPSIEEQQKITSLLSFIDNRIGAQRKIIDKLETLMKVSRRSIFSHQMKFKNAMGNCFPNWNLTALKNVCSIIGGGTPDTQNSEYWNGNIQWFTPSEIKSNFILKSERTISELGLKNSSARILPQGTVLLTTRATIGEAAIAQEECSTNQGFQSLIVNENCHNVFLLYWIKENKFEFIKRANGSTFPEISKSEIKQIKVRIPDLEEQTKIGDFLSSIDEKIETEQNILTQYELQKKYLLANLFV